MKNIDCEGLCFKLGTNVKEVEAFLKAHGYECEAGTHAIHAIQYDLEYEMMENYCYPETWEKVTDEDLIEAALNISDIVWENQEIKKATLEAIDKIVEKYGIDEATFDEEE